MAASCHAFLSRFTGRPSRETEAQSNAKLDTLKLSELRKKAVSLGISEERLDKALDADDAKKAFISLIQDLSSDKGSRVGKKGVSFGEEQPNVVYSTSMPFPSRQVSPNRETSGSSVRSRGKLAMSFDVQGNHSGNLRRAQTLERTGSFRQARRVPSASSRKSTYSSRRGSLDDAMFKVLQAESCEKKHELTERQFCYVQMLLSGALHPLEGFMTVEEYRSVVETGLLPNGTPLGMPVVLDVSYLSGITRGEKVLLTHKDSRGNLLNVAVLTVTSVYTPNKVLEAERVYGTTGVDHPGVAQLMLRGGVYLGGSLYGLDDLEEILGDLQHHDVNDPNAGIRSSCSQVRHLVSGTSIAVLGLACRSAPTNMHFEVIKRALQERAEQEPDSEEEVKVQLLLMCGPTKMGDIPTKVSIKAWDALAQAYARRIQAQISLTCVPCEVSMAGPREAIFRMLVASNYGCTHFVAGRDIAGCKSTLNSVKFYEADAAQSAVMEMAPRLGIDVVCVPALVYTMEEYFIDEETAEERELDRKVITGTELRRRLRTGEEIPEWYVLPEAVRLLRETDGLIPSAATLRIIHVNDVYELTEMPSLKTLVDEYKHVGKASKTIVTMGGDFLAPSLLSSLDHGRGMMEVMNACGFTHCCFGNHECDVPHDQLLARANSFKGVWLNTNMTSMTDIKSTPYEVVDVESEDGSNKKSILLLGLLCNYTHLYRKNSFNGNVPFITPINECAKAMSKKHCGNVDAVLPLTHQDQPDDEALAEVGVEHKIYAVLGGHDHGVSMVDKKGCKVAKAGMDAHQCLVMDLIWSDVSKKEPHVSMNMLTTADFPPDEGVAKLKEQHMAKVLALDRMVLATPSVMLEHVAAGYSGSLTSLGTRKGESSIATMLCTAAKRCLNADVAVLEGGSVRANQTYDGRSFSYGDLNAELPFENLTAVVNLPGSVLMEAVKTSRDKVAGAGDRGYAFFLHLDNAAVVDESTNTITQLKGEPFDSDRTYAVALGMDLGVGSNQNQPLLDWAKEFEDQVPDKDAAVPLKQKLLEYFARLVWQRLPSFEDMDTSKDGKVSEEELRVAYMQALADVDGDGKIDDFEREAANAMVTILLSCVAGAPENGVSKEEYEKLFVNTSDH